MALVGPGALQEYSAPSRGRRARGSVYVDDPAVGFFVAGSSLRDMNGIYTRKDCAVPGFRVAMSYAHSGKNGWCMALCAEQRERALPLFRLLLAVFVFTRFVIAFAFCSAAGGGPRSYIRTHRLVIIK